jgi:hypothetical protein
MPVGRNQKKVRGIGMVRNFLGKTGIRHMSQGVVQ